MYKCSQRPVMHLTKASYEVNMKKLKIIIIGAGIGGPAAAIGLVRNGHDVTMFERAVKTGGVGYAFHITPNSDRCLKHLGIDAEAGVACAASSGRMIDVKGNVIKEMKENEDKALAKKATPAFAYRVSLWVLIFGRRAD
jgi:salicylate hydroxylase